MKLTNLILGEKAVVQSIQGGEDVVEYFERIGILEGMTLEIKYGNHPERINVQSNQKDDIIVISKSFARNIDVKISN